MVTVLFTTVQLEGRRTQGNGLYYGSPILPILNLFPGGTGTGDGIPHQRGCGAGLDANLNGGGYGDGRRYGSLCEDRNQSAPTWGALC